MPSAVLHIFTLLFSSSYFFFFFFFNDTATTEIYTLSLHDALPISTGPRRRAPGRARPPRWRRGGGPWRSARRRTARGHGRDRKSTRLNSSHGYISYAVFCLKKKKKRTTNKHFVCRKDKNKQTRVRA